MKNITGIFLLVALYGAVMLNAPSVSDADASAPNPDAKTYYNSGTAAYEKGDFAGAVKELSKAIKLEPKAPDAYYNRGLSFRRQHEIGKAISDFSSAIRLYAFQPSYYLSRCNARIVKGDLAEAIEDASHAIQLMPEEARAYFMRGLAYMLRGDLDEALEDSIQALQLDPFYPDAQRLLQEIIMKKQILPVRSVPSMSPSPYMVNAPKEI